MTRIQPPNIDPRSLSDLLRALREMAPHYTREWAAKDDDDPGVALLKIFSFIGEGVISRLNRAPDRNFLAFLNMLGIRLLQARPARGPVTFVFADGTELPFIVDSRTQVSAPPTDQRPEDLPFETLTKLLVVPSALTSLVAVDPEVDAIYQPPPGFLTLKTAATLLPELTVEAFSAAKAKNLQLDPPGQLEKGDFLRIDQKVEQRSGPDQCVPIVDEKKSVQSEHLVVSDVKGAVVTLSDPLKRGYIEGTTVRKVTQFELFEAKNWQEHILYLAHKEYFAIKSEAQITIRVQHAPGASSNLQPLKVVWEFFGKIEALKDEPERWHEFEVDADGTQGLSRDGQIFLTKPAGEIKETEIFGKKSRWIRARLDEALPATPPTPVPKIELIDFAVSSGGKNLPPDKAFNNDTPLTTDVPFLPFGTEPRIFDRFSIASEEAFSKPGAEVTLDLQLDFTDLLASPSPIFKDRKIRAFAHGASGRLVEFQIDPRNSSLDFENHRAPSDSRLVGGTIPAVVEDPINGFVGVFVRVDNGRIHLRYISSTKSEWYDLQVSGLKGELSFDPAAVQINGQWSVYVVADNRVHVRVVDPQKPGDPGTWTEVTSTNPLNKPTAASTPCPVLVKGAVASTIWTVVTDDDGHTWVHDGTDWQDLPRPLPMFLAAKNARPYAVSYPIGAPATEVRIFVRSAQDELISFTVQVSNNTSVAENLEAPPGVRIDSNASAIAKMPILDTRVFVRGSDNELWERELRVNPTPWKVHLNPLEAKLAGDPFALAYNIAAGKGDVASILSTSNKNLLLEFRSRGTAVDSGTLAAGPTEILLLSEAISSTTPQFVQIRSGPGAGSDDDSTREIAALEGLFAVLKSPFAVLTTPLKEIPNDNTRYDLFEQKEPGDLTQDAADDDEITLPTPTAAREDDYIFVKGQFEGQLRRVDSDPTTTSSGDTVAVDPNWDNAPKANDHYVVLRKIASMRTAGEGSARRVVLAPPTSLLGSAYPGLAIELDLGAGQLISLEIDTYLSSIKGVVLKNDLSVSPLPGSQYKILVGNFAEGWQTYRDPNQSELRPELSWEYWNGKGWVHLPVTDSTENFLVPGNVVLVVPDDIEKTEVAGQENFWIRARIVGGDYGRELFKFNEKTKEITIVKDPIRPPRILKLGISYQVTELKQPQFCLTLNSLNYLDQTAANTTPNKNFQPFEPLSDEGKALYFGFDRAFKGAPVKIYFAAKELEVEERSKPKLVWSFATENNWKEILADDKTEGFTRPDFVTLDVPEGFQNRQELGRPLYWMRAALTEGEWKGSPLFSGVFLNTVEVRQARTVRDEILGSSTAEQNQKFQFQQRPVIEGEEVRVREALTDEEREQLKRAQGKDAVFEILDQENRVLETWIRWTEVPEFFDSDGSSRHYRLDRHTGEIEFGDGLHGRIPPAGGDNIRAFVYQAGGGAAGNVEAEQINTPVTAVAGVDSVINPVAAGGGSDAATNEDMLTIGPAQISHRDRAVTPEDFERLALEASREVRKARCLPNRNANGRHEVGWTTVHIVPDSKDPKPTPSLELRRAVQRYLADRADATLVDQKHIVIGPPEYVPVTIEATIFAKSLDDVSTAEQRVKKQLEEFLHPLKGGREKEGWEFGRDLAASDLYALLEAIDEVDHVDSLSLFVKDSPSGEHVAVAPDALIASGTHKITTTVATENR
jgi:baseplate J-like protein